MALLRPGPRVFVSLAAVPLAVLFLGAMAVPTQASSGSGKTPSWKSSAESVQKKGRTGAKSLSAANDTGTSRGADPTAPRAISSLGHAHRFTWNQFNRKLELVPNAGPTTAFSLMAGASENQRLELTFPLGSGNEGSVTYRMEKGPGSTVRIVQKNSWSARWKLRRQGRLTELDRVVDLNQVTDLDALVQELGMDHTMVRPNKTLVQVPVGGKDSGRTEGRWLTQIETLHPVLQTYGPAGTATPRL